MGCCISKCRPKRRKFKPKCTELEDSNHVHDKLVISQAPFLIHKPVSPSASSTSISSFSSATCTGIYVASSLSTSSSSTSLSVSKDLSFSNEFLWSCAKDNPHIMMGRNLIRGKMHPQIQESSSRETPVISNYIPLKQAVPGRPSSSSKKRARANSPKLVRQKSFKKLTDQFLSSSNRLPNGSMSLRSPSPSRGLNAHESSRESSTSGNPRSISPRRRFNGDQSFRDSFISKTKIPKPTLIYSSSSLRTKSFRGPNANDRDVLSDGNTDSFCHQTGYRLDENAVEEEKQSEPMIIENFNNPLIALDCFIFL